MKRFIIYYFCFLFFSLSIFASGVVDSQDGFQYLAVARNIYYNHEPTAPVYEYTGGVGIGKNIHMSTYVGKDGKTYTSTGLGYSLAMLPAVAITDLVYQHYQVTPPVHFPLESDWLILLLTSFVNVFFAAMLGVIIFLYLVRLKLSIRQAFFISLISLLTTNLFVFSKHIYAHMMFTSFLVLSFYLLKKYSQTRKRRLIFFSAISYGITALTYNQTVLLTIPSYILYYIMLIKPQINWIYLKSLLQNTVIFFIATIPFLLVYFWFENTRTMGQNLASPAYFTAYSKVITRNLPIPVFIEGLYGQLLSPGRSIFIYSPLLLIVLFFWHKIRRSAIPELIVFLSISFIYIIFYAMQRSFEPAYGKYIGLWSGESSWGPRYLLPIIPFGMLIVGHIYQYLNKKAKVFIFFPLLFIGLYVEILGVFIPYQVKFHNLEQDVMIAGDHYTYSIYSNLLPKNSPIYTMSHNLINLFNLFPKTLDHGPYNIKFFDGIDFPFNVGLERWRVIDNQGFISFDNSDKRPVEKISFNLINHPIGLASSSAVLQFSLNNHLLFKDSVTIPIGKRLHVEIPINKELMKNTDNQLLVEVKYEDPLAATSHRQILGLLEFAINGYPANLESLDLPYISSLGPAIMGIKYQNYGGPQDNNWRSWNIHTQIFERVPDFWWAKAFYYWDIPKTFFQLLLLTNIIGIAYFGIKTFKYLRRSAKI